MPNDPKDPITPLMESAASTHELFMSYVNSGFTRIEALYLVGQVLSAAASAQARKND
jgi:hypothetical protein